MSRDDLYIKRLAATFPKETHIEGDINIILDVVGQRIKGRCSEMTLKLNEKILRFSFIGPLEPLYDIRNTSMSLTNRFIMISLQFQECKFLFLEAFRTEATVYRYRQGVPVTPNNVNMEFRFSKFHYSQE